MPEILRVMPEGLVGGRAWTNVWDILTPGTGYADAQEAVDYIGNLYFDYWRPSARTGYSIARFNVAALGTGLPMVSLVPAVGTITGANSSADALPRQIALLLRFSSVTTRPNRSRKYIPGFTEGSWDGGNWNATLVTAMTNFAQEILDINTLSPSGLVFVVARAPIGVGLVVYQPLAAGSVDTYPVTQRRRRA